jgi:Cysteine synthase
MMIDLMINDGQRKKNVQRCKEKGILLPTFAQMRDPAKIPSSVKNELSNIGLWDVHPRNLFRVNWHNEPVERGGGFGEVNYLEIPRAITGTRARIIGLAGKWFPTGAHKVGAAYACLAPELVTGRFDPANKKAVWPSTGNYCRGGAYISRLLSCPSIAILPAEMSRERFEWLATMAEEVIRHPGLRIQCQGNLRQMRGAGKNQARRGHLQPVRPASQPSLALPDHRPCHGGAVPKAKGSQGPACRGAALLRLGGNPRLGLLYQAQVPWGEAGGGRGPSVPDDSGKRIRGS